jgi:two-component system sensor histidine kinase TtrS
MRLPAIPRRLPCLALILTLGLAAPSQATTPAEEIRIGVLAFRGAEQAVDTWMPTASALARALPDHGVVLVPLDLEQMRDAVERHTVDFVITNPGHYVELEADYGITRIATLETTDHGTPRAAVGSVIFTRADNDAIRTLKDLKGSVFEAVDETAFGGFQIAWRELKAAGVDPFEDLDLLRFTGFPLDSIVLHVRDGLADAGTVRACLMEEMAAEGQIDLADFRILNPQPTTGFPCHLSSQLYPDWPFAKLHHTDRALAKGVAIVLLSQGLVHPVNPSTPQWTVPLSYQPVYDLYFDLRLGPFAMEPGDVLAEMAAEYWEWPAAILVLLTLAVAAHIRTEHMVTRRTAQLNAEMEERRRAQEEAQLRLAELAHVSRQSTMGELAAGLAHEINQPLAAITNYANGCIRRMEQRGARAASAPDDGKEATAQAETAEILSAIRLIVQQAQRAAGIIQNIRVFLRKGEAARSPMDINRTLRDAAGLLAVEARHNGVEVTLDLGDALPDVLADRVQLEQVVVNLMRNAIDALKHLPEKERHLTLQSALEENGDAVLVSVRDSGPGLPPEVRGHLFEPFFTTKATGMGLGLSISQNIIESHGGWIGIDSDPAGTGTTVAFTLPAWQPSAGNG